MLIADGFFRPELTWDGIIAIIAIVLGVSATLGTWSLRRWRTNHPIKASYSLDPYSLDAATREDRLDKYWQLGLAVHSHLLVKISPHVEASIRKLRVRLVQRRWFSNWKLFRWVPADEKVIRIDAMLDMLYQNSSSPLYYFESDKEASGSFLGWYFNDHDHSRGVDIPTGEAMWIGLVLTAYREWSGRLEIDTIVRGQRIFERKPLCVSKSPAPEMASFSFGNMMKPYVIGDRVVRSDMRSKPTPCPESAPDTASSQPQ